jgi:hypothetical protein
MCKSQARADAPPRGLRPPSTGAHTRYHVFIAASILVSLIGSGASTRAGAVTWFLWLAFVAFQLLRKRVRTDERL